MDPSDEAGRVLIEGYENENHGDRIKQFRPYLKCKLAGLTPFSLQSEIDASDVVQESFIVAQRHVAVMPVEVSDQLRAWLSRTLQLALAEASRRAIRKRRRIALGTVEGGRLERVADRQTSAVTAALRKEVRERIKSGLLGLSEFDRMIVRWRCFDPLGFSEIGRRLREASPGATRKRYVRAIGRLSRCINGGE